ncbi:MAG: hypothetical protein AAGD04_04050 [Pseudomonadota bacterium]
MADYVAPSDMEDVLSSIRRLVSQDAGLKRKPVDETNFDGQAANDGSESALGDDEGEPKSSIEKREARNFSRDDQGRLILTQDHRVLPAASFSETPSSEAEPGSSFESALAPTPDETVVPHFAFGTEPIGKGAWLGIAPLADGLSQKPAESEVEPLSGMPQALDTDEASSADVEHFDDSPLEETEVTDADAELVDAPWSLESDGEALPEIAPVERSFDTAAERASLLEVITGGRMAQDEGEAFEEDDKSNTNAPWDSDTEFRSGRRLNWADFVDPQSTSASDAETGDSEAGAIDGPIVLDHTDGDEIRQVTESAQAALAELEVDQMEEAADQVADLHLSNAAEDIEAYDADVSAPEDPEQTPEQIAEQVDAEDDTIAALMAAQAVPPAVETPVQSHASDLADLPEVELGDRSSDLDPSAPEIDLNTDSFEFEPKTLATVALVPTVMEEVRARSDAPVAKVDEAQLQAVVGKIVRQELQGVLGERITRNVRKLVRREIQRAFTSRDLD